MKSRVFSAAYLTISLASASTITFRTPGGATNPVDGQPLFAQVSFETLPDRIQVTVTNRQSNPTSVSQALNAIAFQPTSNAPGATLLSSSSEVVEIQNSSTPFTPLGTQSTGWRLNTSGAPLALQLCLLCVPGPKEHLLLGASGPASVYSNANGSIAGNGPHNPFLQSTAQFIIYAPGVTAATTITRVIFSFGTSAGVNVGGCPDSGVPEPGSVALMAGGVLLICLGAVRRRRRMGAA